jgi:hypothetical protein
VKSPEEARSPYQEPSPWRSVGASYIWKQDITLQVQGLKPGGGAFKHQKALSISGSIAFNSCTTLTVALNASSWRSLTSSNTSSSHVRMSPGRKDIIRTPYVVWKNALRVKAVATKRRILSL